MFPLKRILLFAGAVVAIYVVLVLPWPHLDAIYGGYFRALGRFAFGGGEQRIVLFQEHETQHNFSSGNTRMTLANRDLLDASGSGPTVSTDLNTRSIGWTPTALVAALVLAMPISWPKRVRALLLGLLLVQVFILFSLQTWLWDNEPALSLLELNGFWKEVVSGLDYALIMQLGASFTVPVLIWLLVTLPGENIRSLSGGSASVDETKRKRSGALAAKF